MLVVVTIPFVGLGFNMPAPGTLLDVTDEVGREMLGLGVVRRYETKVDPLPEVVKKKPSGLSQVDPVRRQPTRPNLRRYVTK